MTRLFPLRRAAGRGALRLALVLLGLLAAGCAAQRSERALYVWTDAQGNTRYSPWRDRIPAARRGDARVVAQPVANRGFATWAPPAEAEPFDRTPGAVVREEAAPPPAAAPLREAPLADQTAAQSEAAAPPPGPQQAEPSPGVGGPAAAASAPPVASAPPAGSGTAALDARIDALEQQVQRDEEALKALISDPEAAASLRASPALREISERLPALQAELRALRAQRAAASDG